VIPRRRGSGLASRRAVTAPPRTVKYWYAYFAMRNIEWAFQRMLCLSGV
jgi:hypothetical protein